MDNVKIKPLTKEQLIVSFDRLTRFKNTEVKYFRVFSDILINNLIFPKFKKFDIEEMDYEDLKFWAQYVINTSLEKSYLADTSLQDCIFDKVNFLESDILHTSFSSIDISSCCLKDVRLTLDSLKGAIVSEEQALAFSKLLGIKIKED